MEKEAQAQGAAYVKMVKLCGVDEKEVRQKTLDLSAVQDKRIITFDTRPGEVDIRVSASSEDEAEAKSQVKRIIRELKLRFGSSIFTTSPKVTLEETIVDLLREQKMTIATVESCTGGLLSARLTDVSGVSEVFKQGFITYSNKAKRRAVGVKKMTLKKYTAVSEQAAAEMAKGGAFFANSDICVSVTGYAGPEGGEDGKPVGLVYIGCSIKGKAEVEEYHFSGNRRAIRELAAAHALILLRRCILTNYEI